ncbi:MAG: hypothetical protein ABJB05_11500 [Parafilimonas sp.]
MKKLSCILLLTAFFSCKTSTSVINMNGVYKMEKQNFKGKVVDTTSLENNQLKIYIDSVMMYVLVNHAQDVSAFAVGKYSVDSGKLVEHIMYNATENLQSTDVFSDTVTIAKNDTGYVQTTSKMMSEGEIKITETYTYAGTKTPSLLDGIWKQVSSYALRGKDTIKHNDIEYKSFYEGNFSYGDYYTDSSQKRTGISYGTFSIDSSNNLTEAITVSTWPELAGKTFVLGIIKNSNDIFTQTTVNATGDKEISVYERVKL